MATKEEEILKCSSLQIVIGKKRDHEHDVIFSLEHFVFRDTFPRTDNGGNGDSSESSLCPVTTLLYS